MATKTKKRVDYAVPPGTKKSYTYDSMNIEDIGPMLRQWREYNELTRFEMDDDTEDPLVSYHLIQRLEEGKFTAFINGLQAFEAMARLFGYEVTLTMRKK